MASENGMPMTNENETEALRRCVMKKICIFMAMILLLALVAGCAKNMPDATIPTDDPAAMSNPATDALATDGTAATDNQDEPAVLSVEEEFKKLLGGGFYWRALGCTFEKPEDIAAKFYFYLGVGSNEAAIGEELAFILNAFKEKNPNSDPDYGHNYVRLPVEKINEALSILNVTIEDIQIPKGWAYYDKTDAYYFWVSDAYGVPRWSVTKVEKEENGIVKVYWQTNDLHFNTATNEFFPQGTTKMVYTMQLQSDGTYRVLSNLPEE